MGLGRTLRDVTLAALVAGCSAGCSGDDVASIASWHSVAAEQPASLLSVWGTSANDVWVTGGRSELAGEPTLLHRSGETWTRVDSGERGVDLWWVFGFDAGELLFTGSRGTILRYRGTSFERMATPRSGIIFGLWGATPDDLWAVGKGDDGRGIVWRYDGVQWSEPAVAGGLPSLVLKVHGQRSDDVWISAGGGVTLHWDGVALSRVATGITSSLFSIVTTPDVAIAVGGMTGGGEIVEYNTGWTLQPSAAAPAPWRGIAAGGGRTFAVGESGIVGERTEAGWQVFTQPVTQLDFHAAWLDPDGGLWGVGGNFDQLPLSSGGFLAYYGVASPGEVSP